MYPQEAMTACSFRLSFEYTLIANQNRSCQKPLSIWELKYTNKQSINTLLERKNLLFADIRFLKQKKWLVIKQTI